jgi:hypothetical protein
MDDISLRSCRSPSISTFVCLSGSTRSRNWLNLLLGELYKLPEGTARGRSKIACGEKRYEGLIGIHDRDVLYELLTDMCSKIGTVYVCSHCQSPVVQPLGRIVTKVSDKGNESKAYKSAPRPAVGGSCDECGSTMHVCVPDLLSENRSK